MSDGSKTGRLEVLLWVTAGISLIFLLAACSPRDARETDGSQVGAYSEVVIPWKGKNLYCVRFDTGGGNHDDSGLSCDWVAYHGLRAP